MAHSLDPQVTPPPSNPTGTVMVPAEFLDRILDRLDRMEQRLEQLVTPVEQAPKLIGAVADTVDGWTRTAQERGVDVDASLVAAQRLVERLADPETLQRVERLVDKLGVVEESLTLAEQLPGTVAMAGDVVDGLIRRTQQAGVDLDDTLKAVIPVLGALSDPKVLSALETLVQRTPELADLVAQGPQLVAAAVDSVDGVMGRMVERGVDVQSLGESITVALTKLGEVLNSPQFGALMNSGVLDPGTLEMVGKAGSALVHARMEACVEAGMFGALRATSDRDVQRAIGFAIKFANAFGQELAQPDNLKHLAATGELPARLSS